jgi:hypothetical protein
MSEKKTDVKVEGLLTWNKHPKAPDFVIADLTIDIDVLIKFFEEQKEHIKMYDGRQQLKAQILSNQNGGCRIILNTWKPA